MGRVWACQAISQKEFSEKHKKKLSIFRLMWQSFPAMNNQANTTTTATLLSTRNGDRYAIRYASKDGEKTLVGKVIPYEKTKQGKEAFAKQGEIKESPYIPAVGYGDGVMVLKSNPEGEIYFSFQKQTRDEKGRWAGDEIRRMKVSNILEIEKVG